MVVCSSFRRKPAYPNSISTSPGPATAASVETKGRYASAREGVAERTPAMMRRGHRASARTDGRPPGSLLLRIQGGLDTPRELLGRALSPEVQEHDAWLLVRHVVVDRDDVDVRVTQRLEDVLELVLEHREVAIDHRGSLAPRECCPGVHAHRLPDPGAAHGRLAAEGGLRDPVLRLRGGTENRLERLRIDRALRRDAHAPEAGSPLRRIRGVQGLPHPRRQLLGGSHTTNI